jgi:peptidoglycan/LPS O-acetylase OafA/YrhL
VWLAFSVLSGHSVYVRVAVLLLTIVTLPVLLYHSIEHPMIQLGGALARVPSPRTAATEVPAPVATIASQSPVEGSQIPILNVHDAS